MSSVPIFFEFEEERAALLAMDTLMELGYHPNYQNEAEVPMIHIHVEDQDLTSALEIAQAHGGRLVDRADSTEETGIYGMAYQLADSLAIPAHVVNEDWSEVYSHPEESGNREQPPEQTVAAMGAPYQQEDPFDPSEQDYDHFSAGVRL